MSNETWHEAPELLSPETQDMHRAIISLREELEAIDAYQQRAAASSDDELRAVLVHNENEEIEHAMMILEWIRRKNPVFDVNIGTYLRSTGAITAIEKKAPAAGVAGQNGASSPSPGPLGIGSLKGGL